MRKAKVLNIVKQMCEIESTDCRSLNKKELARQLLNMAFVPINAEICEIPLDWNNQIVILFMIPKNNTYYSLFAGIGNDGKFYFKLSKTGILQSNQCFFFFNKEKVLSMDYFRNKYKTVFFCYEDGRKQRFSMRDVYRQYCTIVDQDQKDQGTTFESWLDEMEKIQILNRQTRI